MFAKKYVEKVKAEIAKLYRESPEKKSYNEEIDDMRKV